MYWKDLSLRVLLPILGTQKMWISEESKKESRDEVTQRAMEELYQKQCGSRWEPFCIESGCWLVASGDRTEVMWTDLGTLKMRRAVQLITFIEESQQGEHYSNQAWIKQERKREFWWLQNKIVLDRTHLPDLQVCKLTVCSPVPLMQASCQKLHQGYELHWKMGCHSDTHIVKKKDQFQELSLSEESLFCPHLTEVCSELPRPSHVKRRIRWSVQECFRRRFRFVQFSIIHKHVMRDRVVTSYIRKRLSIQNKKNWSQDRAVWAGLA